MSVVVVATLTPKPGRLQDVIDGFEAVNPLVHDEPGCELYAAHTDGTVVVMVERWTTVEDLDAHGSGAAITELRRLHGDALDSVEVLRVENLPFGQPGKATIA